MSFEIEPYKWEISTRPCTFTLALAGGSVFADFDVGDHRLVTIIRISFDGYGCCNRVDGDVWSAMSSSDSALLERARVAGELNTDAVRAVLRRHFRDNSHIIWRDALEQYGLLPNDTDRD